MSRDRSCTGVDANGASAVCFVSEEDDWTNSEVRTLRSRRWDRGQKLHYKVNRIIWYHKVMKKDLCLLTAGARLRRRRGSLRLTLADVSRRSGVTIAQISRIENGLADPRLSTLMRILEATGGTLADVSSPPVRTLSVDEALERRELGRTQVSDDGHGESDVGARLDRKERLGIDVAEERAMLESS